MIDCLEDFDLEDFGSKEGRVDDVKKNCMNRGFVQSWLIRGLISSGVLWW